MMFICLLHRWLNVILFTLLVVLSFVPQAYGVNFSFELDRPQYVGSRPLGMGNAFTAVADGAEAGFWNPAGLVQWHGVKIFASAKLSDRKEYAFDSKCIAYSYRDLALFWGNKIALRVNDDDTPDFNYYSLAYKLNPYVAVGFSAKFKRKHPCEYYQFFGYSPGYDLGVLCKPDTENSIGMLIQRLSSGKRLIDAVSFGFAHRLLDNVLLTADMAFLFYERFSFENHIGLEWQAFRWFVMRAGVSEKRPTAGFGLLLSRLQIDCAWIHDSGSGAYFLSGGVEL